MSLLPYKEEISANNEISKSVTSFTLGGDALQKNFEIFEGGKYKIGAIFQWSHEKAINRHLTRITVGGIADPDLSTLQNPPVNRVGDERIPAELWTVVELAPGIYNIAFQFATSSIGKVAYLNYRKLYVERWD